MVTRKIGPAALVFFLAAAAHAHIIIPPPMPPHPIPHPRPILQAQITEHAVKARMRNGVMTTEVRLVCHNPNATTLEGTFLFEVPGDAAIRRLTMMMNGKAVKAELLSAEEARKIYEDIVRRMKDPALLEIAGERLIRARIFPIPPNGNQTITLTFSHHLPVENGLHVWRYPLRARGPAVEPTKKLTLLLDIESDVPIKSIVSPSHKVDVAHKDAHHATVSYEGENVIPENDLSLYVTVSEKDLGLQLLTFREQDKAGYFMAILGAGYTHSQTRAMARKSVLFVVDTSGSMATDDKIAQVRKALAYCLEHLNAEDRFNVVDFSTTTRTFKEGLAPADKDTVAAAVAHVATLEARGGTAIEQALKTAVDMVKGEKDPVTLIFLTDGKPTIGTQDTDALVSILKDGKLKGLRFLAFGVGHGVNTHLLDRLTQQNHGATTYVRPGDPLDQPVVALHNKISYPALRDVKLRFAGAEVTDVFPQELPDLFYGSHLTVVGRYTGTGDHAVTLTGTLGGEARTVVHEGAFPTQDTRHDALPAVWATRKIGYLLDEIRLHGDKKELREEVVRLSKEYGIITPYTSFLVAEDEATPTVGRPRMEGRLREAMRANGPGEPALNQASDGMKADSGAGAFDAATSLRYMKGSDTAESEGGAKAEGGERRVRRVDGKAYYLIDGRWVVSTWDGEKKTVTVTYLSDEYFRLARTHLPLARAFALGERVVAEYRGTYYEVVPAK